MRSFLLRIFLVSAVTGTLGADVFAQAPAAQRETSPYQITVQKVFLKNGQDEWVRVIEPDRQVDLAVEQPTVSFFNNGPRVPKGAYKNFRLEYLENATQTSRALTAREDFKEGVPVRKGSFIRVDFNCQLDQRIQVLEARLIIDETEKKMSGSELLIKP